ncbi:uncharacterized protein [Diadema antillarum]|uniref:uncharacterized protein n=1 Tax=Diadema antillarum TaxID=105358 RepID=UPI003A8C4B44
MFIVYLNLTYLLQTFIVRQARQKDKLSLTLKHPGMGKGPYIESYPIHSDYQGVKLANEDMLFPAVDDLIAYHLHSDGALPCRLALPMAVMTARNLREIQSLAILEEDFWKSTHSKSPTAPVPHDPFNVDATKGVEDSPSDFTSARPVLNQSLSVGAKPIMKTDLDTDLFHNHDAVLRTTPATAVYGMLTTTPPVIYENAETKEKLNSSRPRSLDSLTQLSLQESRLSSSGIPNRPGILRPPSEFDRQDMRFSSASEFDFVTSTTEQRYPPPKCAPPPPPPNEELSPNIFMMSPVQAQCPVSAVRPAMSGVEYSLPNNDQPPLPPKRSAASSTYGTSWPQHQISVSTGYRHPGPSNQRLDAYQTPQPGNSVCSLQQQWQQQQPLANYSAPPPATSLHSSRAPDSSQFTTAPRAAAQMQNILQPTPAATAQKQPDTHSALPEFDPLFESEYRHPQTSTDLLTQGSSNILSTLDILVRDMFVQCDVPAVSVSDVCSTLPVNNNSKSATMTPVSSASDSVCEAREPHFIKVPMDNEYIPDQEETISDHEMDELLDAEESMSRSLESNERLDYDVVVETSESIGIPFTENQNGNHQVLSQSVELSDRVDESEIEESREEKKDYKRNKSSLSQINRKIKGLAKKGSEKASERLHRISSGKSRKRDPSVDIQETILRVVAKSSTDSSIGLGALVHSFIRTQEEKCETDKPEVVLRSVRQFMSGTKNYLLNNREPEVNAVINKYANELDASSLEAIVEGTLHQCVLAPLQSDISMSCLNEYNRNGSMALMDHNIMQAKSKSPEELGIKPNYIPPRGKDLEEIKRLFSELQEAYSPLRKLDLLLKIVSAIYNSVRDKNSGRKVTNSMGADDFLPMLIYVLVQCEMMCIEIEADYMWGLLDPAMLSGEGGYYLTTLSSAICVLKQFEEETNTETKGFLTVLAAPTLDPTCISLKTLPVLPGMVASEVCRILAHRLALEEEDAKTYRLYLLRNSSEIELEDFDSPLKMKTDEEARGVRGCRFGFKSHKAKINWPIPSGLPTRDNTSVLANS